MGVNGEEILKKKRREKFRVKKKGSIAHQSSEKKAEERWTNSIDRLPQGRKRKSRGGGGGGGGGGGDWGGGRQLKRCIYLES